ncbi:superoxide dismutase [Cu-Zn] [Polytolypa hystricis UAMH7299]|uniref:Superoxide dismutase [Cu-Zn] n=1 Tax=Polytolypa hystricis (strain UAMH7299) TaxID=1447883 RepID=A0A2B7YF29_POLH7|nr:superoxide dismutase [Cu-Zn] [Polytolypa hystricis UAMH7299]
MASTPSRCLSLGRQLPLSHPHQHPSLQPKKQKAVAVLRGDSNVKGTVTFEQAGENSPTVISWNISGHDANAQRGFHVHQFGDNTNGCTSAGPHFNPFAKSHGAPVDDERHVGDLGNITTDAQGNAIGTVEDKLVKLIGEHSVLGRTVVVHAGTDDLGKGGNEESKKTGNAGPRPACGMLSFPPSILSWQPYLIPHVFARCHWHCRIKHPNPRE